VNRAFAEKILGTRSAVGRHFQFNLGPGELNPVHTVVGVVTDTKYNDLHEPIGPIAYFPIAQETEPRRLASMRIFVRSRLPVAELTPQIVAVAREIDPSMLVSFRSLEGTIHDRLLRERLMATLSGFFGGLAVLLATVGLYGVMSYMVTRRRNEIGIRMALGADPTDVVRMILGDAALLLGVGLAVGAALSIASARAATTLLFGVSPGDPATLATAALGLAAVAALASWIPAHRASRLDPTVALREE
jgi:ABC-type antimicrobial peptide transport system permease subunit